MNTGALQSFAVRQLITPEPYSPPTTNAAFFIDGMTATHCALLHSSSGMALSGELRSSLTIVPASLRRLTSSFDGVANVELAIIERTQVSTTRFILASAPSCVQGERLLRTDHHRQRRAVLAYCSLEQVRSSIALSIAIRSQALQHRD